MVGGIVAVIVVLVVIATLFAFVSSFGSA